MLKPYLSIHTNDVDSANLGLQGLYGDVGASVRGAFEWDAQITNLGSVCVSSETCTSPVQLRGTPTPYVILLPTCTGMSVSVPRSHVELLLGGCAALFSSGERFELTTKGPISAVTVRIDPVFLSEQLEAITGEVVHSPIVFDEALSVTTDAGGFVERLCHFIVGESLREIHIEHPVLLAGIHESLALALLTGQPHNHSALLRTRAPPSSREVVRLVEEYVDTHADEVIGIRHLAALTGASTASIDAAFRVHRGTTFASFLHARRLEHARRALLAGTHIPLTSIAHRSGFFRYETFENAYFKAFRELPGETSLRALVATSPSQDALDRDASKARFALLSPREREVCMHIAAGLLNKQIAAQVGITERTVREHRGRVMKKLGVNSVAELVRLVVRLEG